MAAITINVPTHTIHQINSVGNDLPLIIEMGMSRLAPVSIQAYMETVSLFAKNPTDEALADFRFSRELEEKIDDLVDRNNEDQLSQAEKIELERLSFLEGQLQVIKARALVNLKKLSQNGNTARAA